MDTENIEIQSEDSGVEETTEVVEEIVSGDTEEGNEGVQEEVPAIEEEPSETGGTSFFSEDEDETISLSSDELSNILDDTEDAETEEVPTVDSVLQEKESGYIQLVVFCTTWD